MQEFDDIRPYRDDEVPEVLARLKSDPKLVTAAARLFLPGLHDTAPGLSRWLTGRLLAWKVRSIRSIDDFQLFLSDHFKRLIDETTAELEVSGLEALDPERPYLFMSNHRDILMDTGLVYYTLHRTGHRTPEAAVGDNLLGERFVADLMRLNKSFMIERSVTGKRAIYRALTRTSHYIQHVLASGSSVWIAQREGRAKDGFDRTDPAVLKMLALAWRKEVETFGALVERISLVPVSISYELDPCDRHKAHELASLQKHGTYTKAPNEDLMSIVTGMTGFKGRVHVHYAPPIRGVFEDADALADEVDRAIVAGLEVFPTQAAAARELGFGPIPETREWLPAVEAAFTERIGECPPEERRLLLEGYGNLIRNRAELGIGT
jgi:1-acyl-sn-glycerol-3-phosphate acyltransferase